MEQGSAMLAYVNGIWRCRYFWLMLVRNDLRMRYRRSLLGLGWSLLQPIAMTCIICFVFQTLLQPEGNVLDYAAHVLAGLACWNFILTTTLHGCQCFYLGESYIRQYPAPLAIYPLRTALACSFHFLIAITMVVALTWIVNGFGNVLVLPALAASVLILAIVIWSLAVIAGFANVYFQDTQHLCEVGFQILFYMTPIIYPESMLRAHKLAWLVTFNPVRALIDLIRKPIVDGQIPDAGTWFMALLTAVVLAVVACRLLGWLQKRLIFSL
jgi:lipopolysaccharide transport system permease protein